MEPHRRLAVLLAVGVCLVLACWFAVTSTRTSTRRSSRENLDRVSARTAGREMTSPNILQQVLAIEARNREQDQTVWAPEMAAQKYEQVIVALWDDLRKSDDPFAVLGGVSFEELVVRRAAPTTKLEHGIELLAPDGAAQSLRHQEWLEWLEHWKKAGYGIEQTEWRHVRFDPGTEPASTITLTAHVANKAHEERLILKCTLRVQWRRTDADGEVPVPARIDATGFQITRRTGEPAFREVITQQLDQGPTIVDPQLILYDLNRDGLSEIILPGENLVYWNRGNGRFETAPLATGLPRVIHASVLADFTGDGAADLLCADPEGLLLFEGNNAGQFTGPGKRVWRAPEPLRYAFVMTAGDIDSDGDLDVWLAQYKQPYTTGQMPSPYYDANDGFPSFLLLNNGDGTFKDGTEGSGLAKKRFRRSYSASFVDLNNDGKLDLLVVSDFAGIDLYLNDGRGRFIDATASLNETHSFGMAHTFGDYNLDGKIDFLVVGMNSPAVQRLDYLNLGPATHPEYQGMRSKMTYGNRLYLSTNTGFTPATFGNDLTETGWAWGATSFDFDNDGALDIYIVNGHKSRRTARDYESEFWRHDIYLGDSNSNPALEIYFRSTATRLNREGTSYGGYEKNRLLWNRPGNSFVEIGYLMGVALEQDCRNVVSDDLDADGRVDLVTISDEAFPEARQVLHVFHNALAEKRNWIGVRLNEHAGGNSPLGARVILNSASRRQIRQFVTGDSFRSQHSTTAHFGLGDESTAATLEVLWPNGKKQTLSQPAINRYHTIQP